MASTIAPQLPNLELTKINFHIHLYTPPPISKTTANLSTDPTTILLCPWMGASLRSRALNAALQKHHSLYPNARILLVRSNPQWFLTTSQSTRRRLLKPTLDVIDSDPAGDSKRILCHVFSNGGGLVHMDICTLYKETNGKLMPIKALITDSFPLRDITFRQAWNAFKVGLPKSVLWWPAAGVMLVICVLYWVTKYVFMQDLSTDYIRKSLLDEKIVDRKAKRLYCYGVKDEIIGWKGVELEIADARRLEVDVKTLRDEVNPHVQYMIKDEKRYWSAVEEVWDSTRT